MLDGDLIEEGNVSEGVSEVGVDAVCSEEGVGVRGGPVVTAPILDITTLGVS